MDAKEVILAMVERHIQSVSMAATNTLLNRLESEFDFDDFVKKAGSSGRVEEFVKVINSKDSSDIGDFMNEHKYDIIMMSARYSHDEWIKALNDEIVKISKKSIEEEDDK